MALVDDGHGMRVVDVSRRVLDMKPTQVLPMDYIGVPPPCVPRQPITIDLNAMAQRVHAGNRDKWWMDLHTGEPLDRNKDELLMLKVSECSEAMEGERKSSPEKPLMDDKVKHRLMAEVEVADIMIRSLDFAGGFGLVLNSNAIPATMTDNRAQSLFRIVKLIVYLSDAFEYGPELKEDHGEAVSEIIMSCFAYCEKFGYDLIGAYEDKMIYNETRHDHTREARLAAGGKKF